VLHGRGGNDVLKGGGGADTLDGGSGNDTLKGGGGCRRAQRKHRHRHCVHEDSPSGVTVLLLAGETAFGDAEGDELYGIENLIGSAHADTLWGDDNVNVLQGLGGNDTLKGFGGADTLYGGAGADTLEGMNGSDTLYGQNGQDRLNGGSGGDFLYGGNGADTFVWSETSETWVDDTDPDIVRDFDRAEGDVIDLSTIDADVYAGGNQAFTFIGTAIFSGTPGEIRYYHSGGNTYIDLQTGNSVDVEGVIRLDGLHDPQASWFVL
jgi:serralysin